MKKKIDELYGAGSNFYSGRSLGRDGADQKFSSYIGQKSYQNLAHTKLDSTVCRSNGTIRDL